MARMSPKHLLLAASLWTLAHFAIAQRGPATAQVPATPQVGAGPAEAVPQNRASQPSSPSAASTAGGEAPATSASTRRDGTRMLGAGAFNTTTGLESVLNSGTPSMYDRKAGPRKVCPPPLENRNNVCVVPPGSVLQD